MSKKMPMWKENAIQIAERMFNDFYLHPENKGRNFTWEDAPEFISRLFSANMCTWYPLHKLKQVRTKATDLVKSEVRRLAKEKGLV